MEQINTVLGFQPIIPRLGEVKPADIVVRYNADADTLSVHFFGLGQAAVSVDVNEYLYLRVNRESRRIVGIQIEGYLEFAVRDDPRWLAWADLAGIDAQIIERVRSEISADKKRTAALQTTFDELELTTP